MSFSNIQEYGRAITIKDEGITLNSNIAEIDFVGSGVTGSAIGSAITESIPGIAASGGQTVVEDLTSQCDGVNKIFNFSNNYASGSIFLSSTQFPIIYRPGVDFTETDSNEITLTSEVSAPQSGQTLTVMYAKS